MFKGDFIPPGRLSDSVEKALNWFPNSGQSSLPFQDKFYFLISSFFQPKVHTKQFGLQLTVLQLTS